MAKNSNAPIMSNKDVVELIKILRQYDAPTADDFLAMLEQVKAMEKQLKAAVGELVAMRRELAEAREHGHPVKDTLQKAVNTMQAQVSGLRNKLAELKENIINGCKNTINAFKEKGVTVLDGIARFFKVKPILENIRDTLDKNIKRDDKMIAKIEVISTEYHQAGLHVKNIGRAIRGKDAAQEAKPPGKIAAAISYPFRIERRIFASIKKSAEAAIGAAVRLEEKAAERKPSVKDTLKNFNRQVEKGKAEKPTPERARNTSLDR